MKQQIKNPAGFSLIEVIIALAILTVGILVVAKMQDAAIKSLSLSRHLAAATQLAQGQLEFLRSLPFDDFKPTEAPSLQDGGSVKDASNNSVFLDDSPSGLGDGLPSSWHGHKDNPLNERGGTDGPQTGRRYYVRWTVERGGPQGSPDPSPPSGSPSGTHTIGIPGPFQMRIVMEVIWWEDNRFHPAVFNPQMTNDQIRTLHAHRVQLVDLHQPDL